MGNLRFQFLLERIELQTDLLGSGAPLVDLRNSLFEVDAGFDGAENPVAGTEYTVEQLEFLGKGLIDPHVSRVRFVEGKTFQSVRFGGSNGRRGATGAFTIEFASIAVVSVDGTVRTVYNGGSGSPSYVSGPNMGMSTQLAKSWILGRRGGILRPNLECSLGSQVTGQMILSTCRNVSLIRDAGEAKVLFQPARGDAVGYPVTISENRRYALVTLFHLKRRLFAEAAEPTSRVLLVIDITNGAVLATYHANR